MRDQRRRAFGAFLAEKTPVLEDFVDRLGLPATAAANNPETYLCSVSDFMRSQDISSEDRVWILTRIGYLVGEILAKKYSGVWFLNEFPDSRYFLRYVVGRFAAIKNQSAMVDPFAVADLFVSQSPGRDLVKLLAQVEGELNA